MSIKINYSDLSISPMDATFKYFDSVGNGKSDFANEHQSIIYSWIPLLLIGILLNAFTVREMNDESYHFYHYIIKFEKEIYAYFFKQIFRYGSLYQD